MAIYSQTAGPFTLLSAVAATGTALTPQGTVVGFSEASSAGPVGQSYSLFNAVLSVSSTVTSVTADLLGSQDGKNWVVIGTTTTTTTNPVASLLGTANTAYSYIAARLATLVGGTSPTVTLTVVAAA